MQFSTIFLKTHLHHRLTFLRCMGGGPRTFPGGLNKWQWKRMHEKKAREKEKRLLDQEKQLYQARIRSQIRAQVASAESPNSIPEKPDQNQPNYGPLPPQEHIKALADRFMKAGAKDLWNENDGPLEIPPAGPAKNGFVHRGIDFQGLIGKKSGFGGVEKVEKGEFLGKARGNLTKPRYFCTFTRQCDDFLCGPIDLRKFKVKESCFGGVEKFEKSELFGNAGGNFAKSRLFSTSARRCDDSLGGFGNRYVEVTRGGFDLVGNYRRRVLMDVGNVFDLKCYYSGGAVSTETRTSFSRNGQSSVADNESDSRARSGGGRRAKWPRFRGRQMESSDDDSDDYDDDEEEEGSEGSRKVLSSSAALGKYDTKKKKRLPLNFLEDEVDLSQQVEAIRKKVLQRKIMQEGGAENGQEESILSTKRFDDSGVSSLTVRALTEAGYVQMTRVQEATLSACLEGKDALVKARAGTGKSIAFLLPAIETVLKASSGSTAQRVPPIYVLILCPTRELASQICAEANVLLKHHDGIGVQTLIGGTRFKVDQRRLESEPCQIIVATPGRLLDHIENKSGISVRLMGLHMLILDEADYLLDLGFRKDVEKLVDCLPRKRQSLLISATIPKEVRRMSQLVLKREHVFIDTVGPGSLETHAKVKQFYLVAPHGQHLQILHHLLKSHTSQVLDYKVVVFCATAMMTSLVCSLFREMKLNVREIHSKKSPLYCTRISNEFKESKGLILITSDVSARGMDYPDVTLVVQVGIPSDRGQYIHRLGRTGRQGKEGEGFLLIAPWEQYFLDEIKDLPLETFPPPDLDPGVKVKIEESLEKIDASVKEAAYHAWLGYYNSINAIGRDKTSLVELANQFSASIGLQKPPSLYRKTALKMGLKGIPGIRIRK